MAIERYHGSALKAAVYDFFQPLGKRLGRLLKTARSRPADELPAPAAALMAHAQGRANVGDLAGALDAVRQAADIVEAGPWSKRDIGGALVRLGDCRRGLQLMAPSLRVSETGASVWSGGKVRGQTLLVWQRTGSDMGAPIRLARFVRHAERLADHVVVVVEERLVPLFQRTFPKAELRPMQGKRVPDEAGPGVEVTSFEALAADCVTDWRSIETEFVPLVADPTLVSHFRASYGAGRGTPLIGISWGSRNPRKNVPDFDSWAGFVRSFPATFVSLQYGSVGPALRRLRGDRPEKLIADDTVDQMKDMDRFAAQVAAMDAVIGISNTAIHLAGALGVPMVIVGDDKFRGQFPLAGESSGWYPRAIQVRQHHRNWQAVLDEAGDRLRGMLMQT